MTTQEILQILREKFDSAAKDLGFKGSVESVSPFAVSLVFFGSHISLEIQVDLRDFFLFGYLFRGSGPKIPRGYVDDHNKRQRMHIQEAIKELKLGPDDVTKRMQKLAGKADNCEALAELLLMLVERYWREIEADCSRIFP